MGKRASKNTSKKRVTINRPVRSNASLSVSNDLLLWDPFVLTERTKLTRLQDDILDELDEDRKLKGFVLANSKGETKLATVTSMVMGSPTQLDGAICYALLYLAKHTKAHKLHFRNFSQLAQAINMPRIKKERLIKGLYRLQDVRVVYKDFYSKNLKSRAAGATNILSEFEYSTEAGDKGINVTVSEAFLDLVITDERFAPMQLSALSNMTPLESKWYKYLSAFDDKKKHLHRDLYKISKLFGMNVDAYKNDPGKLIRMHTNAVEQVSIKTNIDWFVTSHKINSFVPRLSVSRR